MIASETECASISTDAPNANWEGLEKPSVEPDFHRMLMVEAGAKITLGDIDPSYSGIQRSHEQALPIIASYVEKIGQLQYVMHAEKKHSLLIVLQGVDAGGKDRLHCGRDVQGLQRLGQGISPLLADQRFGLHERPDAKTLRIDQRLREAASSRE